MLGPTQVETVLALFKRYQWLRTAIRKVREDYGTAGISIIGQDHDKDEELVEAIRTAIIAVYEARSVSIRSELIRLVDLQHAGYLG